MASSRANAAHYDHGNANTFRYYAHRAAQLFEVHPLDYPLYRTVDPAELDVQNDFDREHRVQNHPLRNLSRRHRTKTPNKPSLLPPAQIQSQYLSTMRTNNLQVRQQPLAPPQQNHYPARQFAPWALDRSLAQPTMNQSAIALGQLNYQRALHADIRYQHAIYMAYNDILWRHGIGAAAARGVTGPYRQCDPNSTTDGRNSVREVVRHQRSSSNLLSYPAKVPMQRHRADQSLSSEPISLEQRIVARVLSSRGHMPRPSKMTEDYQSQREGVGDSEVTQNPEENQRGVAFCDSASRAMEKLISNRNRSIIIPQHRERENNSGSTRTSRIVGRDVIQQKGVLQHTQVANPVPFAKATKVAKNLYPQSLTLHAAPKRVMQTKAQVDLRRKVLASNAFSQTLYEAYKEGNSNGYGPSQNIPVQNITQKIKDTSRQKLHVKAEYRVQKNARQAPMTTLEAQTEEPTASRKPRDRAVGFKTIPHTDVPQNRRRTVGLKTLPFSNEDKTGYRTVGQKTLSGTNEAKTRYRPFGTKTLPRTEAKTGSSMTTGKVTIADFDGQQRARQHQTTDKECKETKVANFQPPKRKRRLSDVGQSKEVQKQKR